RRTSSTPTPRSCSYYYGYQAHRHPHSFPTRRSSDLPNREEALTCLPQKSNVPASLAPGPTNNGTSPSPNIVLRGTWGERRGYVRDRKSTRLNSSHVKNAYAVLCLKKKK